MGSFQKELETISQWHPYRLSGRVTHIIGLLIESNGPIVRLGELCYLYNSLNEAIPCEVVGFKENKVLLMSLGELDQISPGAEVFPTGEVHRVPVSNEMQGRILGPLGEPIDGKPPFQAHNHYPVIAPPPPALERTRIHKVLTTGIKSIDSMCTFAQGQRMGIFAGSGVGKSTLMGMIARGSEADINVIALIGERGREVKEFIEKDLGEEGLSRSVVIAVTSDQSALLRARGASVATAIAEYFRNQGKNVILMMDSVTRYAMALREIGLAIGEPPTTKGYTPSVFTHLPKLLERAGTGRKGSITGIYTVLVEADDMNDPIADSVRSILDGHIILSRKLATANHYPAIDVLNSLSRLMNDIVEKDQVDRASCIRRWLQSYTEAEDLINIGAYVKGSNSEIDQALERISDVKNFLTQAYGELKTYDQMYDELKKVTN